MIRALVVIGLSVAAAACARVTINPPRSSAPILLHQYDTARVWVYTNGPRCKVVITAPTVVIETSWDRCQWIAQP